jgi:hypothetical protein
MTAAPGCCPRCGGPPRGPRWERPVAPAAVAGFGFEPGTAGVPRAAVDMVVQAVPAAAWHGRGMCRNIRVLHNFEPPTTDNEIEAAAIQYVRKVSGTTRPSTANQEVFDEAVRAVTAATRTLLDSLVTKAPPRDREVEAAKARARAADRYGTRAEAAG